MLELAPQLIRELEAGAALVVPSTQRAAAVRLAYAAWQLQRGRRAFRTPDVQPFAAWAGRELGRAALHGLDVPRCLQPVEEWLLWRAAASGALEAAGLPPGDYLADPLRRAAELLREWHIPAGVLPQRGEEGVLLAQALERVDADGRRLGAVGSHAVAAALAHCRPAATVLAGFAYRTPARAVLLAASGARVGEYAAESADGTVRVAATADRDAELETAAEWCRARLEEDPGRHLLVVIPDVHAREASVARVFDQVLSPRNALSAGEAPVYAIEGGRELAAFPGVRSLLSALRLYCAGVPWQQCSAWLRGPGWPGVSAAERARLDVRLRALLPAEVNAEQLLRVLGDTAGAPAAVAAVIAGGLAVLGPAGVRLPLPAWAQRFAALLAVVAPEQGGSSRERQVRLRFGELLAECAALAPGAGLTAGAALDLLVQLARRARFEPATGDPAVLLTGALADPVVRYDGIWVAGVHAGALPQPASPDPFIPAWAQRQAGVPTATPAGSLQQARATLASLRRCARELVLSWAVRGEAEQLPSPLLAELAGAVHAPLPRPRRLSGWLRQAGVTEAFSDSTGSAWPSALPLPAGTRAVELQSRCAFRAYAELRLGAVPLPTPQPGISPAERGRLLHRALELLWGRLADSAGLAAAQAGGELDPIIVQCVSAACEELPPPADASGGFAGLRRAALARERARAVRLIGRACALEQARPPFTVTRLEAPRRLALGGALLDVRIDRIDRVGDVHLIFDYKTGQPASPDWLAARPTHPQLLLYLFAAAVPVAGLSVVHLTPQRVVYRGIADRADRLPGVAAAGRPWAQQNRLWHDQLTILVADFLRGAAAVDPLPDACRHCHLHACCRIADRGDPAQDADWEPEGA